MAQTRLRLSGEAPDPAPGSVLLSMGFRPFFLAAAGFGALIVPLWVLALRGGLPLGGGGLVGAQWHVHELTIGYGGAVLAGFLLTAVRMWSGGRETVSGLPLLALVALWGLGRVLHLPGVPGGAASAAPDLAFLLGLTVAIGRPLIAGRSRRNYGFLVALPALGGASLVLHAWPAHAAIAQRLLVDLPIVAIAVVGARITPLFTRNATQDPSVGAVGWVERAAPWLLGAVLVADLLPTGAAAAGVAGGLAGAALWARMARWGTLRVLREPLLLVLHAGYAALGLGLLLRAAPLVGLALPAAAATHTLTVGALGLVTIGMLARVSTGHTGRPLTIDRVTTASFALMALAAVLRVGTALFAGWPPVTSVTPALLVGAATAWSLSLGLFLLRFGPVLTSPRPDGRPG